MAKTRAQLNQWLRDIESNYLAISGQPLDDLARQVGVDLHQGTPTETDVNRLSIACGVLYWGQELVALRKQRDDAMRFCKDYMRDAAALGLPKAWIARASGVTRQTVYDTIG